MLSCTEFIPAYSELFKYLENKSGKAEVVNFWEHISDAYVLGNLGALVRERGIQGCWDYWSKSLNEEAADFTMTLDKDAGVFTIDMHHCPSKGRLLEMNHMTPYPDYCGHSDLLYRRVLEPLGFRYEMDLSRVDHAACTLKVTKL